MAFPLGFILDRDNKTTQHQPTPDAALIDTIADTITKANTSINIYTNSNDDSDTKTKLYLQKNSINTKIKQRHQH